MCTGVWSVCITFSSSPIALAVLLCGAAAETVLMSAQHMQLVFDVSVCQHNTYCLCVMSAIIGIIHIAGV